MMLCSGAALLGLVLPVPVLAQDITAAQAIADFAKGVEPVAGDVTLILPEVAEDGFKVLVKMAAPGAEALLLVAPENPVPPIATVTFGPLAARQRFATRIRLARSQTVIALARMPGGAVYFTERPIAVVVGGCGA